jgi:hypothetical protein
MKEAADHLNVGFLSGSCFYTEDGGDVFNRSVCGVETDYTISYPRKWNILHPSL